MLHSVEQLAPHRQDGAGGAAYRDGPRFSGPNLALRDSAGAAWKVEPGAYQVYVGSSSRDIRLQRSIVLR